MTDSRLAPVLHHLRRLARPEGPSDAVLLTQVATNRDAAALGELVRRYGPLVWGVCRRMLYHVPDAEDAYQATFLALARRAGAIRKPDALASWLHATAFRIARRMRQDANRRQCIEAAAAPTPAADPAREAAWRELGRVVEEEVAALPEKYRLPLLLCYWQGRTNDEAARQLDCPAGTVKTRLAKARQILHDRLTRRGMTLPAGVVGLLLAPGPGDAAAPALAASASARVTALAAPTLTTAKRLTAAFLLAVGLAVAGAFAFPASAPEHQVEAPKPEPPPARVDRFGDLLPEGALARLGTVRFRHGNGAATLAFSPDDKTILSFGGDRALRTWDVASGRLLKERQLPGGPLYTARNAVYSPDGRLLGFQDSQVHNTFILWDVVGHRPLHRLPLPQSQAGTHDAAFSPDGKTLVTGQQDGTVRAWDVATGKGRILGKHKGATRILSFSATGKLLSRALPRYGNDPPDDVLCVWDVQTGRELARRIVPEDTIGAALSPDGQAIVLWGYATEDGFWGVQFVEADKGKPVRGWTAPRLKQIYSARFAPDGKTVWFGTEGGVVVWDPIAGKQVRLLPGGPGLGLTFSHDGKKAAALGATAWHIEFAPVLRVWDVATGAAHPANAAGHGHTDDVASVAISPDGRKIASACVHDRRVIVWDAATGRPQTSLGPIEKLVHNALAFTADGQSLLVGTESGVGRWDVATGREVGQFAVSPGKETRRQLRSMYGTDNGRTLLAVSLSQDRFSEEEYALHTWDVATGRRVRFTPLHSRYPHLAGRVSEDGRLALLNWGIYDTVTGQELHALPESKGNRAGLEAPVAVSADGALVASAAWEATEWPPPPSSTTYFIRVWEAATLLPVAQVHTTGRIGHLAFTPDGRRLVTAGREALTLWELHSGKKLVERPAPAYYRGTYVESFATSFALAADGRTLATGQPDGTVLVWDLTPPSPKRPAAPLTAKEREMLWADLAGDDAGRATQAIARLAEAPAQAVALLSERLRPARRPPAEELRRLLADLDAPRFEVRDAATKRLAELGEGAYAALREALGGQPSLEVRRRIEPLLDQPSLVRAPDTRRGLRAVRVLEGIDTPQARRELEALARGADGMRLTVEARAALKRLDRPR